MTTGRPLLIISALVIMIGSLMTAGCFDIHTSKGILFPDRDDPVEYVRGTIAEVRYDFTGAPVESDYVQLEADEFHRSIDNFHLGHGGGDLYIWAQVHFGPDPSDRTSDPRYIRIWLFYDPGGDGEEVLSERTYKPLKDNRMDVAELVDNITGAREGLYSLRVEGKGTAGTDSDVPFFDWYQVSVNGRYSDESYNHNAP